jgi:uncharacterized membrane protein
MRPSKQSSPNGGAPAPPLVARNVAAVARIEAAEHARRTPVERLSDAIAQMAGTGLFAGLHMAWFAGWIAWNSGLLRRWPPFDPFPYSFLTLVVSLEAIFLSIFVLISQNSLSRQSERRAHLDLQVNLLAEQESTRTVALLERIAQQLHVPVPADPVEQELAAPTDIRDVISTLDSVLPPGSSHAVPKTHEGNIDDDPGHDRRTDPERPLRTRPDDAVRGA